MNHPGEVFVLIFAFMLVGSMSFFAAKAFNRLRAQNVAVLEALFLSFIYSILYFWSRGASCEDLEISREKILKRAIPFFILIFGIFFILLICLIQIKTV